MVGLGTRLVISRFVVDLASVENTSKPLTQQRKANPITTHFNILLRYISVADLGARDLLVRIFTCIPTLSGSILLAGPPSTFIIAVRMVGATKVFPPPPNLVVCQQFRFQAQWGPPGMGQGLNPP
ncbi:hypothetical protein EMCRGX_G022833 [Ephydatia muelleri]